MVLNTALAGRKHSLQDMQSQQTGPQITHQWNS